MADPHYPESDPRHHAANIKHMLHEAARHAREDDDFEGKTEEASR
jgi:hypothetical protein